RVGGLTAGRIVREWRLKRIKKHPRYSARVSKVFLQWRLQTAHENVVVNGGRLHVQLLIRSHLHKPKDLRDIVVGNLRCPRKRMVHEIPCATVKIFIELREEGLLYKIPTFVGISRFQIGHGLGYSLHEARADLLIALKPFGCRVERAIEERVDFPALAELRHDQKDSAGRLLRPFEAGARNDRGINGALLQGGDHGVAGSKEGNRQIGIRIEAGLL